jgi:hypothetical protein
LLDELLMAWEGRLYSLQAHASDKRVSVTAEDALKQVIALQPISAGSCVD